MGIANETLARSRIKIENTLTLRSFLTFGDSILTFESDF